ncbi:MAG: hypothetical protein AAF391_08940 [Bacteroidota bacterium]
MLDGLKDHGVWDIPDGVLKVVSLTEFGINGYEEDGEFKADASAVVDHETYMEFRGACQDYVRNLGPHVVLCTGTAAVDTGEVLDGKKVGENKGAVILGSDPENIVEFMKRSQSPIDGWTDEFSVRSGEGPVHISVPDLFGVGRPTNIYVAVCLDAARYPSQQREMPVDIMLSPAAGFPNGPKLIDDTYLLVADTQKFADTVEDRDGKIVPDRMSVWEATKSNSILKKTLSYIEDAGWFSLETMSMIEGTILSYPLLEGMLEPSRSLKRIEAVYYPSEDYPDHMTVSDLKLDTLLPESSSLVEEVFSGEANIMSQYRTKELVESIVDDIFEIAKEMPTKFLQEKIDDLVAKEVNGALDKVVDPMSASRDELERRIDIREISSKTSNLIEQNMLHMFSGSAEALAILSKYNITRISTARNISEKFVAGPIIEELGSVDGTSGKSYIDVVVDSSISSWRIGMLTEHSGELEREATKAESAYHKTQAEVTAKKAALESVEEKLRTDPTNETLLEQKKQIEAEITAAETEAKKQESQKEEAERKEAEAKSTISEEESAREREQADITKREKAIFHE